MKSFLYVITILWSTHAFAQPKSIQKWDRFELVLEGPSTGNPFSSVQLSATFAQGNEKKTVTGFYDGEGKYIIRFMPIKKAAGLTPPQATTNRSKTKKAVSIVLSLLHSIMGRSRSGTPTTSGMQMGSPIILWAPRHMHGTT